MILGYQIGTVSELEVVWVMVAAVGFIFSIVNFRESIGDIRALYLPPGIKRQWSMLDLFVANYGKGPPRRTPLTNGRYPIAWSSARVESARLLIQLIFLSIGVAAMTVPDIEFDALSLHYQIVSLMFRWGLMTSSLLVTLQSIENRRMRANVHQSPPIQPVQVEGGGK